MSMRVDVELDLVDSGHCYYVRIVSWSPGLTMMLVL